MEMVGKLLLLLMVAAMSMTMGCQAAAERKTITHLKGFDGPLPFSLETGYVEVDEKHGVELFYYFNESEGNPAEDPVILWISGGPGCSGLNAILFDNGPLKLDVPGYAAAAPGGGGFPGLLYSEDAWTKVSNMIFIDAPVGSGFSYARETEGMNVTLTGVGRQLRVFLHKWMAAEHPELASNSLYIGGDSYSGYTVTVTALEVANHLVSDKLAVKLNLKGYMVGNARGEVHQDNASKLPFMHRLGLISDELYQEALSSCTSGSVRRKKQGVRCLQARQAISEATSDVNPSHILEPRCGADLSPRTPDLSLRLHCTRERTRDVENGLDLLLPLECRINGYWLAYVWGNDAEVWEMLGVREGTIADGSWSLCPALLPHFHNDVPSTIPYHRILTQLGYRVLVYNGDHDLVIPYIGTQAWIRSLGYAVVAPWRPWYDSYNEVAGFTTQYSYNLTFATVKGAGHMAAESRPKECLHMIRKWISPAGTL